MKNNQYGVILCQKSLCQFLIMTLLTGIFAAGCGSAPENKSDNNSLTISVVAKDAYLDAAINKFKELHPDVNVEVEEYTTNPLPSATGKGVTVRREDPADIEKYVTAMNTQLMSGQGSDIILLNDLPYETYVDKNLLADIGQMMAVDQSFDSSKYYQNILEAVKYKGKLYGMPVSFNIDLMAADKTLLENSLVKIDENAWNWEDFVETAKEVIADNQADSSQELYALAGMDEKRLISSLVAENYSKLVEPEKKTANFNGQEFLDFLNLSKYLLDQKLVNIDTNQSSMADMASRGKVVFNLMTLKGFFDLQTARMTFGDAIQFLKPPGSEGDLSFSTNALYGISNHSTNKELAWEFLKLMVSDEMMSQRSLAGMPINKSVVPQIAQDIIEASKQGGGKIMVKGANDSKAQSMNLKPLAQEEVEFVESLLEEANVYNATDQKIISIVQEETAAFFTGQKTAEATAQLIQDRVSTYLNE